MPNIKDSHTLRALIECGQEIQHIHVQSQAILSQMGKLAECMYLLFHSSSWSEGHLSSLLTNNQLARLEAANAKPAVSPKQYNWVATFWPELGFQPSIESPFEGPCFEEEGRTTGSAQRIDDEDPSSEMIQRQSRKDDSQCKSWYPWKSCEREASDDRADDETCKRRRCQETGRNGLCPRRCC